MIKNSKNTYGWMTKLLHWSMGITIIGLIIAGFVMTNMENSPEKFQIYALHKATGVMILSLFFVRIIWRLTNPVVQLPKSVPKLIFILSRLGHAGLYFFMFAMPFSGVMMSLFGGYDISIYNLFTIQSFEKNPQLAGLFYQFHMVSAWLLAGLIIAHISGALFHHFILKDEVLKRML